MDKIGVILISLVSILVFFVSVDVCMVHAETGIDAVRLPQERGIPITVYLHSGEVIRGSIIKKTKDALMIKRKNDVLSFGLDELYQVEENVSGNNFFVKYRLPFSTAIIKYESKGALEGEETAYIDTIKNKIFIEGSYIQHFEGGQTTSHIKADLCDGKIFYRIYPERKTAVKTEKEGDIIVNVFGELFYFGNRLSRGTVLDRKCRVYNADVGKIYFWHGIVLKEEVTSHPGGEKYNFTKEAVDIQLDVDIPDEKFKIPAGVQVRTPQEMMKIMQEEMSGIDSSLQDSEHEHEHEHEHRE